MKCMSMDWVSMCSRAPVTVICHGDALLNAARIAATVPAAHLEVGAGIA